MHHRTLLVRALKNGKTGHTFRVPPAEDQPRMPLSIRMMTPDDIPAANAIAMAAYKRGSRAAELALYLALQPDGWLLAQASGDPVGMVGMRDYGPFAYIGLMAVHPDAQRQGIGRALMERLLMLLKARGCPVALLDASEAGWPLYASLGFVVDDMVSFYERTGDRMPAVPGGTRVGAAVPDDLLALTTFDTPLFGADRSAIFAAYRASLPDRVFVARDDRDTITGFLFAQLRTLGPWSAATPGAAEALLARALALPFDGAPTVIAPRANLHAAPLLARYGFVEQRWLRHMRLGSAPQHARRARIFGQASFAIG